MKAILRSIATPVLAFVFLCAEPVPGQWLNYKTPGIPRTADGKPDLAAPTPKAADGRPDLSGIWRGGPTILDNIAAGLKPGDVQPWAEAVYQQRLLDLGKDSPLARCLPDPVNYDSDLFRIVQASGVIILINEGPNGNSAPRTIYTDGRELPKDPNPSWLGYSVGRWDGDMLVVDTAGFNDRSWLDRHGHPHTEALRITERFRRTDFGHLSIEMSITDPNVFAVSISRKIDKMLTPDTIVLESLCENERSVSHFSGGIRLSPDILSKYAGLYEFSPDRPAFVRADGPLLFVRFGQAAREEVLAAQSETIFHSRDGVGFQIEFVKDASGAVTHFMRRAEKAVRKGDLTSK